MLSGAVLCELVGCLRINSVMVHIEGKSAYHFSKANQLDMQASLSNNNMCFHMELLRTHILEAAFKNDFLYIREAGLNLP